MLRILLYVHLQISKLLQQKTQKLQFQILFINNFIFITQILINLASIILILAKASMQINLIQAKNKQAQSFLEAFQNFLKKYQTFNPDTQFRCLPLPQYMQTKIKLIQIIEKYFFQYKEKPQACKYVQLIGLLLRNQYPLPREFPKMVAISYKFVLEKKNKNLQQQWKIMRKIWMNFIQESVSEAIRQEVFKLTGVDMQEDLDSESQQHLLLFFKQILKLNFSKVCQIMKKRPPLKKVQISPKRQKQPRHANINPSADASSCQNGKKRLKKSKQGKQSPADARQQNSSEQSCKSKGQKSQTKKSKSKLNEDSLKQQSKSNSQQEVPIKVQNSQSEQNSQGSHSSSNRSKKIKIQQNFKNQLSQQQKKKQAQQQKRIAEIKEKQKIKNLSQKWRKLVIFICPECSKCFQSEKIRQEHRNIHKVMKKRQLKKRQLQCRLAKSITKPSKKTQQLLQGYAKYVDKVRQTCTTLGLQKAKKFNKFCPYCDQQIISQVKDGKMVYNRTWTAHFYIETLHKDNKQKNNHINPKDKLIEEKLMHSKCYIEINQ